MKYLIPIFLLLSCPAYAETLLTIANSGAVSVNKNLTARECDKVRKRLNPWDESKMPRDKDGNIVGFFHAANNDDIKTVECLK